MGCSDEAIKHLSNKEAVSNITSLAAKLQSSSFYTSTTATVNSASDAVQQAAAISASLKSMKGSLTSMQVDATNRKDTVAATNIGKVIALIDQETKLLDIPANQTSPSIVDMEQMILKLITGGAVTPTAQETSNFTWNGLNTLTLSDYTSTGKNINTVSVSADNAKPDEIQKAGFYTEVFNQIKDSGGCFSKTDDEMKSNEWLTSQLLSGGLTLVEYTDPTDSKKKSWNEVSWSAGDTTLKQSTDDTQIAKAEAKYDEETSAIQVKDKTFDLQLANINTEHSAVQTEIDTVKSVIDKNVKSSFKLFQA